MNKLTKKNTRIKFLLKFLPLSSEKIDKILRAQKIGHGFTFKESL